MEKANQYLVVPRSQEKAKLLEFLDEANKLSNISVVRVVGDQDNPKRVIIKGTPEAIEALKHSFDREIIIEPDSDLKLF